MKWTRCTDNTFVSGHGHLIMLLSNALLKGREIINLELIYEILDCAFSYAKNIKEERFLFWIHSENGFESRFHKCISEENIANVNLIAFERKT